ncbi:MAG TPA: M24 family metallopeptidase, partial [Acidobacteriota bacterium]|nr:M24 family metallopeptidase [Acidobacteriota bacterium]
PGVVLPDVHKAGTEVVKEGLKKLGLITDTTGDQYKIWFMHGVSHWLGMDVHDTGDRSRPLEPGMAFTVEPGIYIREDALNNLPQNPENEKFKAAVKSAFEKYKNIGIRIEDDVLVTATGYEHLSKKAPRTITDVENAMRR